MHATVFQVTRGRRDKLSRRIAGVAFGPVPHLAMVIGARSECEAKLRLNPIYWNGRASVKRFFTVSNPDTTARRRSNTILGHILLIRHGCD